MTELKWSPDDKFGGGLNTSSEESSAVQIVRKKEYASKCNP